MGRAEDPPKALLCAWSSTTPYYLDSDEFLASRTDAENGGAATRGYAATIAWHSANRRSCLAA